MLEALFLRTGSTTLPSSCLSEIQGCTSGTWLALRGGNPPPDFRAPPPPPPPHPPPPTPPPPLGDRATAPWVVRSAHSPPGEVSRVQNEETEMTSSANPQGNADLIAKEQEYGKDPLKVRETGQYRSGIRQVIRREVGRVLIDWDARAASEGDFFHRHPARTRQAQGARCRGGNGLPLRPPDPGRLRRHPTVDGSAAMLAKAFGQNGKEPSDHP